MVAGGILKVLGLVVAVILTIVKPCMLPYIILIIILLELPFHVNLECLEKGQ